MPAHTIDDVLGQLDDLIAEAGRTGSRTGFFAVLYRNVTARVKAGLHTGRFEDAGRMERLDVAFANRYLDAYGSYRRGERTSRCWEAAFRAADWWSPLILQHLLLGMNAHINLDLGAAAAETSPGADLPALEQDFVEINLLLAEMLDDVQDRLAAVSPWMGLLDRIGCRNDEAVSNFSLRKAREHAWRSARRLADTAPGDLPGRIDHLDRVTTALTLAILKPSFFLTPAYLTIRLRERKDVEAVLEALRIPDG